MARGTPEALGDLGTSGGSLPSIGEGKTLGDLSGVPGYRFTFKGEGHEEVVWAFQNVILLGNFLGNLHFVGTDGWGEGVCGLAFDLQGEGTSPLPACLMCVQQSSGDSRHRPAF